MWYDASDVDGTGNSCQTNCGTLTDGWAVGNRQGYLGAQVDGWYDKSGNGFHATRAVRKHICYQVLSCQLTFCVTPGQQRVVVTFLCQWASY